MYNVCENTENTITKEEPPMTHRKHAAALLTAVLLLALTACGRQTAAASDPAQTPAAPAVETPVIAAPSAAPTPAAGKDTGSDGWKAEFERSLLENYGVTPDHYEDLGNGIYQVYVKIDGKVVPYVTVDSATGDYHG